MRVAIVGCGPSGLLAAHACNQVGVAADIYALERKMSVMGGAMFLHEFIPGATRERPDGTIRIQKTGTKEVYAKKVYGDSEHPVSFDQFEEGDFPMWSLRDMYRRLWGLYGDDVKVRKINMSEMQRLCLTYDLVISTMPKPILCAKEHTFSAVPIWIRMRQIDRRYVRYGHNVMVYSGDPQEPWYRKSLIDNQISFEYAFPPPGPVNGVLTGRKPIENDCDCWPHVMWAGRFGKWQKGVLTHHVFKEVADALFKLL